MGNNLFLISTIIIIALVLFCIFARKKKDFNNNEQYFNKKRHHRFTAFYINLKSRKDRKKEVMTEFKSTPFKLKRIDGVKTTYGALGCTLSHIKCLENALAHKLPWVFIFEDDVQFAIDKTEAIDILKSVSDFLDNQQNHWSVVLLSYNKGKIYGATHNKHIRKIRNTQTAGAYLVHGDYYKTLLNNFKNGYDLLEADGQDTSSLYALDSYWKRLQEKDNWLCIDPMLFKQRPSYSDIENKDVAYKLTNT